MTGLSLPEGCSSKAVSSVLPFFGFSTNITNSAIKSNVNFRYCGKLPFDGGPGIIAWLIIRQGEHFLFDLQNRLLLRKKMRILIEISAKSKGSDSSMCKSSLHKVCSPE
jgi:hypothetical protein